MILLTVISTIACHRKELENIDYAVAYIPISTDWSNSLVDTEEMSNISIHIFPDDGSEPTVIVSSNQTFNVVQLPIGVYSILIFNDMISDLDGLDFQNETDYDNINVNITKKEIPPLYHSVADDEHLTTHHDHIAAWHLDELIVDQDMVEYTLTDEFKQYITIATTRSTSENRLALSEAVNSQITRSLDSLSVTAPTPVTTIMSFTVGVENLNSAASIEAILSGTTSGSTLVSRSDTNSTGDATTIYDFTFSNWVYDNTDDPTDGKIYYTLNTFIKEDDSAESYQLKLSFLLHTGEMKIFYRDITDQIVVDNDHKVDIELTIGDDAISLPESASPGFTVNGWGDAVHVTL